MGALLDKLPDATNDFEFRLGFAYNAYMAGSGVEGFGSAALDPFGNQPIIADRAAAYFVVNKTSGYWQCRSGTGGVNTPQTTVTTVLAELNKITTWQVKVETDGSVSFWINDTLVASHTTGKIADGKALSECINTVHMTSVATATKGWFVSCLEYKHVQANVRNYFVLR